MTDDNGSATEQPVIIEIAQRVGLITMNRPAVRNAINPDMRRGLWSAVEQLDNDVDVDVIVLTGADPAFCAGLDLRLLGDEPDQLLSASPGSRAPFPTRTVPLIAAVNGPAITGGFELALNCDFIIASDRAAFADTHARVGVMPGWGLTPLLTDAVGRTRAREISLTGNFVGAHQALEWGLVNRVVSHDDLLPVTLSVAADIVGNDQVGVRRMLETYREQEHASLAEAWQLEGHASAQFGEHTRPGSEVSTRRADIIERGRRQI